MRVEFDLESLVIGAVIGFLAGLIAGYLLNKSGGVMFERDEMGKVVAVLPIPSP